MMSLIRSPQAYDNNQERPNSSLGIKLLIEVLVDCQRILKVALSNPYYFSKSANVEYNNLKKVDKKEFILYKSV